MTQKELYALMHEQGAPFSLADTLSRSNYDELLQIDVPGDDYHYVHHVNGKYCGIVSEGGFSRLMLFAADNFLHPEDREAYRAFVDLETLPARLRDSTAPGAVVGFFRLMGTDGSWIPTRQLMVDGPLLGEREGIVCCYVYDDRTRAERDLSGNSTDGLRYDEHTGLVQGSDFLHYAQTHLSRFAGWCILDLVIEQYKLFTDWFGLESGRYLLNRVGAVLRRVAGEHGGFPGYFGHEEFVALLPYDRTVIDGLYEEIQSLIGSVSHIEGFAPNIGIAMIDGSTGLISNYYNRAALTVEEMERDHRGHIRIYDAALHRKIAEEYSLLRDFQAALETGGIRFWLQPQCRASNRKIEGAESLARWRKADGSWVSPAVFVPLLEKYGLVTQLDEYIWDSVCAWMRRWLDAGGTLVPVSVNVSPVDIFTVDVPDFFTRLMDKYQLDPYYIKVEITESAYVENAATVREAVVRLRERGFKVLMDDFGSGYSSLNMLRSLNVDLIKLDAQFLHIDNEDHQKGISILESIVNMTKNLSTPIIVEGVETREQLKFLTDLGCSYVQGFYFYRPMPPESFELLLGDKSNIDESGFVFKGTSQIHAREFLDEALYSDAMLNNILGPVAFYNYKDGNVDIVRYNEQFYRMVGLEPGEIDSRILHIQDYLYPEDREPFFRMLEEAELHQAIGAKGLIRTYKPNGVLVWLSLDVYFINEDAAGKRFYASAENVTELQYLNTDLPGGFYRARNDDDFELLFVSQTFREMTGYTDWELRDLFDNRLINMIHPEDRDRVRQESRERVQDSGGALQPYRLRRKRGDYLYVAEQCRLTDLYGDICWQAVVVDVTEVMKLRNQMRILEKYYKDTILFLRRGAEGLRYEVAVHGLAPRLGLGAKEFEEALNAGSFCKWIEGCRERPHQEYTRLFLDNVVGADRQIVLNLPDGGRCRLLVHADPGTDEKGDLEYIMILHELEGG